MKKIYLLSLLLLTNLLSAQPCNWDASFGINGKAAFSFANANSGINAMGIQNDNGVDKIIVAGTVLLPGNPPEYRIGLARLYLNGSLDNSFGNGGTWVYDFTPNSDDWAEELVVLPDNSFLICGTSGNKSLVAKFDRDGVPINSFGNNGAVVGGVNDMDIARAIALQPDGKMVIAGTALDIANQYDNFAVTRYHSDGSIDSTFGINGRVVTMAGTAYDSATDLLIQPDGKIVAGGYRENGQGASGYDFTLVRYLSNGDLDTTFHADGIQDAPISANSSVIRSIALQPDGKLLAAGVENFIGPTNCAIVRYLSNGDLDLSFGTNGVSIVDKAIGSSDEFIDITLQPDGKIAAVGIADDDLLLMKLDTNGAINPDFVNCVLDFYGQSDLAKAVVLHDDKIVVGGAATFNGQQHFALAQFQNDINVGVVAVEERTGMSLFPNPTSGTAVLQFDGTSNGILEITNLEGQLILRQQLPNGPTQEINLSGQHSGLYLVKVVHDGEVFVAKLLVRK